MLGDVDSPRVKYVGLWSQIVRERDEFSSHPMGAPVNRFVSTQSMDLQKITFNFTTPFGLRVGKNQLLLRVSLTGNG